MNREIKKIYETDASQLKGNALDVIFPSSVEEVCRVVAKTKRVVVRGAGTGLAGGCVPQGGLDVVLDMSKMDRIGEFDRERLTIEVEAGVVLDDLQDYLFKYNLEFPVQPSSHAVATIGGMIATDAVGNRAIKYGKTSNWIKWIEVIDGFGKLEKKGITELSDYSGMEGISGVVVRACLKLSRIKRRTAMMIKIDSLEEIASIVRNLKRNSAVSMIEFLDKKISDDLGFDGYYHLIVEYEDDSGKLEGEQYDELVALRDRIYPLVADKGYTRIEDPKIMIDKFVKLMDWLETKGVPTFGHIGVGILHPCFSHEQEKYIPEMMKFVKRLGGHISGEHGIGILKKEFVEMNDKKILINIKKRTDPLNKFNVGKMI